MKLRQLVESPHEQTMLAIEVLRRLIIGVMYATVSLTAALTTAAIPANEPTRSAVFAASAVFISIAISYFFGTTGDLELLDEARKTKR